MCAQNYFIRSLKKCSMPILLHAAFMCLSGIVSWGRYDWLICMLWSTELLLILNMQDVSFGVFMSILAGRCGA